MDYKFPGNNNDNVEYRIKSNNTDSSRTGRTQGTGSAYEQRRAELERRRQAQSRPRQLTPEQRAQIEAEKERVRRHRRHVESGKSFLKIILVTIIVVGASALLSYIALSCVNDVLAIHVSSEANTSRTVTITEGMNTEAVIRQLKKAGVIKNVWFCKLAAQVAGYTDTGYIPGDYSFQRSQGLEKMLDRIKDSEQTADNIVTLTFPEGYTLDRILESLESNGVCSRESIESAMRTNDYSDSYKFLKTITDKSSRFYALEGYFYPDTYDFYLGESADSVITKFLDNFASKWTDAYTDAAEKKNLSIDKVVMFASIVEKEAGQGERDQVAGIILNRLNSGMLLNCDSTSDYIIKVTVGKSENEIARFNELYDTYKRALPVGPICNPGAESINAVLYASPTDKYYFIHDATGQIRTAKTLEEHENNITTYGLAH